MWARFIKSRPNGWMAVHPMWQKTPSGYRQWHMPELAVPESQSDAMEVEQLVRELPVLLRKAIRWYYINGRSPVLFARRFGVTVERLRDLVLEARGQLAVALARPLRGK
jgi:DNA-directed RNA polymerase specialized sigma24 family protein